jgi:hypothetical protein
MTVIAKVVHATASAAVEADGVSVAARIRLSL